MMRPAFAAIAVLLAQGCTGDPCNGVGGACVALTINGTATITALDRVDVTVVDSTSAPHQGSQTGPRTSLPIHAALELPSGITGRLQLIVNGYLGGVPVGSGSSPVEVPSASTHAAAVIQLGAEGADAGADLAVPLDAMLPGDLSRPHDLAGDQSVIDAATAGDLSNPDLFKLTFCSPDALFCDDFESANALQRWTSLTVVKSSDMSVGDEVAISSATSNSPTHSASFIITGNGDSINERITLPTPSPALYVRMFVYPTAAPSDQTYWLKISNFNDSAFAGIQIRSGNVALDYSGGTVQSVVPITVGAWQCLVLGVSGSTADLYLGNTHIGTAPSLSFPNGVDTAQVGMFGSMLAPNQIYVDDVNITSSYLPCP